MDDVLASWVGSASVTLHPTPAPSLERYNKPRGSEQFGLRKRIRETFSSQRDLSGATLRQKVEKGKIRTFSKKRKQS